MDCVYCGTVLHDASAPSCFCGGNRAAWEQQQGFSKLSRRAKNLLIHHLLPEEFPNCLEYTMSCWRNCGKKTVEEFLAFREGLGTTLESEKEMNMLKRLNVHVDDFLTIITYETPQGFEIRVAVNPEGITTRLFEVDGGGRETALKGVHESFDDIQARMKTDPPIPSGDRS